MWKLTELNSNVFFLLPFLGGLYARDYIYAAIGLSIIIASTTYHYLRNKNMASPAAHVARYVDMTVASVGYLYVFYFIQTYSPLLQSVCYMLLGSTLLTYMLGKYRNNDPTVHTYFHVFIGIVSGAIPLFS